MSVFKLSDICYLNRYKQIEASKIEELACSGSIKLLPSSKNYDLFTSEEKGKEYVCDGEVITLGRARYANVKYWKGKFISSNNHIIESKNQSLVLTKYLYYFFLFNSSKFYVEATTYPKFDLGIFNRTTIVVPDLDEQKRYINAFDNLSSLIEKSKGQINMLDELIEARFNEMFGNPAINPFNWNIVNISEILTGKVSNGFFAKREDYSEDGNIQVLGVVNIVNRMYSGVDDLPKAKGTADDIKKYALKYGDMLFCRSSLVEAGIGKASIVPKEIANNIVFECHVIRLQLDLNKCVPEFIQVLSTTDFFRKQIIAQAKTATMTTISQEGILKANIILPPIEKQLAFYSLVEQINATRKELQKQKTFIEELYHSTMQRAFWEQ